MGLVFVKSSLGFGGSLGQLRDGNSSSIGTLGTCTVGGGFTVPQANKSGRNSRTVSRFNPYPFDDFRGRGFFTDDPDFFSVFDPYTITGFFSFRPDAICFFAGSMNCQPEPSCIFSGFGKISGARISTNFVALPTGSSERTRAQKDDHHIWEEARRHSQDENADRAHH